MRVNGRVSFAAAACTATLVVACDNEVDLVTADTMNVGGANAEGGSGGAPTSFGTATLDITVTTGDRTARITECSFAMRSASQLSMATDNASMKRYAEIVCEKWLALDDYDRIGLVFYEDIVGANVPAADMTRNCSNVGGCVGPGEIRIAGGDFHGGDGARGATDTGTNHTGTFTLDAFDGETGYVSGRLDVSFDDVTFQTTPTTFRAAGTFEATLFDCTDIEPCTGEPP